MHDDHDDHDEPHHDYDHVEVDHDADGLDEGVPIDDNNPVAEGSKLHLEIHRAVDELGKYAIELDVHSDGGIDKDTMIKFVDDLMRASTQDCLDAGADLIGHVKSFCKVGEQTIMFSMVHPEIPTVIQDHIGSDRFEDVLVVMHIIVHGIWDDVIRDCVQKALPETAAKWGVPYTIRADFFDTEKSIAHHEKRSRSPKRFSGHGRFPATRARPLTPTAARTGPWPPRPSRRNRRPSRRRAPRPRSRRSPGRRT